MSARKYRIIFISLIQTLDGLYLTELHQPLAMKKSHISNDTGSQLKSYGTQTQLEQNLRIIRDYFVMEIFKNIITKEGRRYQISWQWRTQNHNLLENYELLLKRFEKDCDLLQRFDKIIKHPLSKGITEKGAKETLYSTPHSCYTRKKFKFELYTTHLQIQKKYEALMN